MPDPGGAGERRPGRYRARALGLAALALAVVSCGVLGLGSRRPADPDDAEPEPPVEVTVFVDNQNFYDATIYVVSNGATTRLGVVQGKSSERFRFRWRSIRVRFAIRLLASGTYATYDVSVTPGDELELRVPPDLDRRPSSTVVN